MSEQIRLSREERAAAVEALKITAGYGPDFGRWVDNVINAVNEVRADVPLDTVRRSPTHFYVRCEDVEGRYWREFSYTNRVDQIADWPEIYRPEVES